MSIVFNKWHILHPWTLPADSDKRIHLKELPLSHKIASIAIAILASPLLLIGGVIAFYGVSSYFKSRLVEKLKQPPTGSIYPESKQENSIQTPELDIDQLTVEQIKKMTPDEQGALIDQYAKRTGRPSKLTKAQLLAFLRSERTSGMKIFNVQELGKGHCGRYCINNALQNEAISEEKFVSFTAQAFQILTGMSSEDAARLVRNDDEFGVDAGILSHILNRMGIFSKNCPIADLPGFDHSKQQAMENFIGNANFALVGNIGNGIYDMPTENGVYPLTAGHFVALRKDSFGEWWYIDSRAPKPINIALAVIPKSCTLIVPQN